MPFDGMVMSAVRHELAAALIGSRIDKIYQPGREEIHLTVHRPGAREKIVFCANALLARVHLTGVTKENPSSPPVFCMVLRKHLEGARIVNVRQPGLERVLIFDLDARDELGRLTRKELICEVMGKHSNIILVDLVEGVIIDGIRRYSHAVSRHREVLPGRPYIAPPPQDKVDPSDMPEEDFFKLLLNEDLGSKVTELLQKKLQGLSPLLAREITHRSGLKLDIKLEFCGQHELRALWQNTVKISLQVRQGEFSPTLVLDSEGFPVEFGAFELTVFQKNKKVTGTMNQVCDNYYKGKELQLQLDAEKNSLNSVLKKETARLEKKLALQGKSIKEAREAEIYRVQGELITANIYLLEKGQEEAVLEDFYNPGSWLTIKLNSHLTPSENAQHNFKKYSKAKNTLLAAREHLQKTSEELDYFKSVETSVGLASSKLETQQIKQELAEQGYLKIVVKKVGAKNKPKGKKEVEKPQPLSLISSEGFTILVGKNNRQNDYLTLKMAKDEDIWLHTKDIPGSHVIIKTEGVQVPPATLEQAALLAAYHSRARNSQNVPVDYTKKKYVNKPNGAKPGYVIYREQKTLFINPSQEEAQALLAGEAQQKL